MFRSKLMITCLVFVSILPSMSFALSNDLKSQAERFIDAIKKGKTPKKIKKKIISSERHQVQVFPKGLRYEYSGGKYMTLTFPEKISDIRAKKAMVEGSHASVPVIVKTPKTTDRFDLYFQKTNNGWKISLKKTRKKILEDEVSKKLNKGDKAGIKKMEKYSIFWIWSFK